MKTNIATRVIVEITRQIGTGVREYLRDKRLRGAAKKEVHQLDALLIKTLTGLGFPKDKATEAADSKAVRDVSQKPLADRVRAALTVLT